MILNTSGESSSKGLRYSVFLDELLKNAEMVQGA